ncbi:DNA translocase FtsK, partial [Escherichia coli]|nr:DNA translocase FtsK [Escherichia coli]
SQDKSLIQKNTEVLESTFKSFGVHVIVKKAVLGPTVTRYEVQPAVGVKVSKIVNLADDLALALAAKDIRIEAPIPGKPLIGIEV